MQLQAAIFKAYDIRGVVPEALNTDVAHALGLAFGAEALVQGETTVAVGRDGRLSGPALSAALIRGLVASLSTGEGPFRVDGPCEALFLAWEDDEASGILPHLLACGGDPRKVHMLRGVTDEEVPEVADNATVVKLFRVMLLMPVVMLITFLYRNHHELDDAHL